MEALAAFFLEIWNSYLLLSPFERLGGAIGVVLPVATPVWLFTWRKMRGGKLSAIAESKRDRETRISAEAKRDDVIDQLKLAREECETAERRSAMTALALFEKEMSQGNSIKGFHVLNDHFLENRPTLSKMAVELAELHKDKAEDEGPTNYLEGLKFLELAKKLDFSNNEVAPLGAELAEHARAAGEREEIDVSDFDLDGLVKEMFSDVIEERVSQARQHRKLALIRLETWEYESALFLIHQALALLENQLDTEEGMHTMFLHSRILGAMGDDQRALEIVQDLIAINKTKGVSSDWDELVFGTQEAQSLIGLGQYDVAYQKLQLLLPLSTDYFGWNQKETLVCRYAEAFSLKNLENYGDALERIKVLIPLWEDLEGWDGFNTTSNRNLETQILKILGRESEATLPLQSD